MKKKLILICVSVLLIAFSLSGCVALKATNIAKQMLEDYYAYYDDMDIDECIDMFGDEIIDDVGGDDDAEIIFNSRRLLLGAVDEYEVTSFDSDSSFGDAQVVLTSEVQYENYYGTIEEEYLFYFSNNKMQIIGIDFDEHSMKTDMIDDYFEKYDDMNYVVKRYIPYVASNLFDSESVGQQADYARMAGGEYKSSEVTDVVYYYDELDWDDDIYYIAQIDAELEFEDEDFVLYAEISSEKDEVGFNYLEYYPKNAYNTIKKYYENIANGETAQILNMYSSVFFDYSDYTKEEWDSMVLKVIANDFGKYIGYEIYSWNYDVLEINGVDTVTYSFDIVSEFENGYLNEYFTIIRDAAGNSVVGHQISIQ